MKKELSKNQYWADTLPLLSIDFFKIRRFGFIPGTAFLLTYCSMFDKDFKHNPINPP